MRPKATDFGEVRFMDIGALLLLVQSGSWQSTHPSLATLTMQNPNAFFPKVKQP
jgi:hypothetical protein